jgi:hypothetical protein
MIVFKKKIYVTSSSHPPTDQSSKGRNRRILSRGRNHAEIVPDGTRQYSLTPVIFFRTGFHSLIMEITISIQLLQQET